MRNGVHARAAATGTPAHDPFLDALLDDCTDMLSMAITQMQEIKLSEGRPRNNTRLCASAPPPQHALHTRGTHRELNSTSQARAGSRHSLRAGRTWSRTGLRWRSA